MFMLKKIAAATGMLALLGFAAIAPAHAEGTDTKKNDDRMKAASHISIEIGPRGNAHLQGTVTAVSSAGISVKSWGGVWTVNAATSTFRNNGGNKTVLDRIHIGDIVNVNGTVSTDANLTINASLVRDLSVREERGTFSG